MRREGEGEERESQRESERGRVKERESERQEERGAVREWENEEAGEIGTVRGRERGGQRTEKKKKRTSKDLSLDKEKNHVCSEVSQVS